jgi:hypothetical protein
VFLANVTTAERDKLVTNLTLVAGGVTQIEATGLWQALDKEIVDEPATVFVVFVGKETHVDLVKGYARESAQRLGESAAYVIVTEAKGGEVWA